MVIQIRNDGPLIEWTDYWETEHARRGYLYLSLNAGAYRLLVPSAQREMVAELSTATEVVISRGPWDDAGGREAIEILFEDGSDSPFSLHILTEQVDRLPRDSDLGWKGQFLLYLDVRSGPAWQCGQVYYRRAKRLPWLKEAPPPS